VTRATLAAGVVVAISLALAVASRDAAGQTRGNAARSDAAVLDFVVGNVEFLLVHEIAHLLIDEKKVPIIGPQESAADYIATLALIREDPLDPAQTDRAMRFLRATAAAFAESWRTGAAVGADVPYWGAHALSIQRYYQIVCLLYGSDPQAFAREAEDAALPMTRAQDCIAEYARADAAIGWLLANYGRLPDDDEGAAIEIVYGDAPTRTSAAVLREIRAIELFERVTERLRLRFMLERPFTLGIRSCRQPQAAWLPEERELVICYELVDALYVLGMRAEQADE
jgi:hypothetical protein